MLCGLGMVHSHFMASTGPLGVYTTTVADEEIVFPKQFNTTEIFAQTTDLAIKFNNDDSIMYILKGTMDGVLGMPVGRIIVVGPAGQKLKWRGLVSINNT